MYALALIGAAIVLSEYVELTTRFGPSAHWPERTLRLDMGQNEDDDIYFEEEEAKEIAAEKERRLGEEGHHSNCNLTPFIREEKTSLMPDLNVPRSQQFAPARFGVAAGRSSEHHFEDPSHITMCKWYLARSDKLRSAGTEDEGLIDHFNRNPFRVRESAEVCEDWSAPHNSLLSIFSSSLISTAAEGLGIAYSHNCQRTVVPSRDGIDVTTIQQILSSYPRLTWDRNMLKPEQIEELCRGCIESYDPVKQAAQNTARVTHHCMIFPGIEEVVNSPMMLRSDGDGEQMQRAPCAPNAPDCDDSDFQREPDRVVTPLEAAMPLIRNRLYHAAIDYSDKADFPTYSPRSGAIVYIDGGSVAINPELYSRHLPPAEYMTSLQILVNPTCSVSKLAPKNELCSKYAERVTTYLKEIYKDLDVELMYAASTAAAVSRMILTKTLVAPPFTLSALIPALCKQTAKESILFELGDDMTGEFSEEFKHARSTQHWIQHLGGQGANIRVIPLSGEDMLSDSSDIGTNSTNPLKMGRMSTNGDTNVVQGIKTRWDDEPYAFEDTLRPDHLDMNEKRNGGFVSGNNDQVRNPDDFMVRGDDDKDMPGTDSVYFDTQLVPGNVQEMPSEGGYQGPAMDVRPGPGFSDMPPPVISARMGDGGNQDGDENSGSAEDDSGMLASMFGSS